VEEGGEIYSGMTGDKAVDGIKATQGNFWAGKGSPNYLIVDLGKAYKINRIVVRPFGHSSSPSAYFYDDEWQVTYSLDKSTWHNFSNVGKIQGAGSLSGGGISIVNGNPGDTSNHSEDYKNYEFIFTPVQARYIKFNVTKGDVDNDANLEEIEVYNYCEGTPVVTITKSAQKSGKTITYTLTLNNTGSADAKNIQLVDPIPQGTNYVSGSASNNGSYNSSQNRVEWNISSLGAGQSASVTFQVTIP
jgi:uncharacterized repeat protein (TIGR01451 family)